MGAIDAVVFDLDGVLIDSEPIWSEVRHAFALEHGGRWLDEADSRMMGMATDEWAAYMHEELRVDLTPSEIAAEVIERMSARYGSAPPLFPGAVPAVQRLAAVWPLGLASSSPARLITTVLEVTDLAASFRVALSTEEVGPGKPAPDVYLEVARRLGVAPPRCAAVEDSTNGLRAADAAGMRVLAVPTTSHPPASEALERADVVLRGLDELDIAVVDPDAR